MKSIKLPSGTELRIAQAPWEKSWKLTQAVMEETTKLGAGEIRAKLPFQILISEKVQAMVWECFEKCLYGNKKIVPETFEPESARQDYVVAVEAVIDENTLPFTKSLYAKFSVPPETAENSHA